MDIDKVVINYFNRTNSLSLTANMAGISPQKARKILITAGVYETNLSHQIDSARKKGLSDSEIKKLLGISDKVFCCIRRQQWRNNQGRYRTRCCGVKFAGYRIRQKCS